MWKPKSEQGFDMNPYDSFMRKHLQHYGYYTGRNASFRQVTAFEEWDKTYAYNFSDDSSDSEYENKALADDDDKDKEKQDDTRTTQVVYSCQSGKMVPKLREPRQLYGFGNTDMGTQQAARWPSEIQVMNERVKHIGNVPSEPEPFYKPSGLERTPLSKSGEGGGRVVFEYEPIIGSFFVRSRVGGHRNGCTPCTVEVSSDDDHTLIFESRFESGNLAKAVKVGEYDYELWLRNDLYTNKHTQWYYFRVSNTRKNVQYRFTVINLQKPDSLYNHGMRPLYYSEVDAHEKRQGWIRAGSDIKYYRNNVKYSMGKSERYYYSLTWTCQFSHDFDNCYWAHCYPYTYSDLQDYLNDVMTDPVRSKLCKQRVLCRTLAGNMVYMLTITSPPKNPEEAKNRKAVVVTARVHPGETNASWMMKGFLDYLMSNSADAKLLRDTFIFKIVPMLNPDGVIVGNYRCSLAGRDLNRNYKTMLKDSFPSVWHTKTMIKKLLEEREIVVYCDLHGHSRRMNVFIYGCENRGNPHRKLRERIFPVMLNKNAPEKFAFDSCKFKVQKSKEGTGRIVMWNMGIMNSYTLEATFCGSSLGNLKGFHFTQKDFESMGFHFCDTLLDYCDPDNTKCAKILMELEDRLKQEILQKLERRGMGVTRETGDLDLESLSDIESSDGGSDSSVSDGLPVHLQYMADQLPKKKKKLKTRKERDKQKCVKEEKKTEPPCEKKESLQTQSAPQIKPKPYKYTSKRPKSKNDDRAGSGTGAQERCDDKPHKKGDQYLQHLTSDYVRSGILNQHEQQHKDIPHLRYTAASRPAVAMPINVDGLCPHHEKTFAAHYVANHLQQYGYSALTQPVDPMTWLSMSVNGQKATVGPLENWIPDGGLAKMFSISSEDLGDMQRYKYSMRKSSSAKPDSARSKSSQRHLVEISAAAQRQQELKQQQKQMEKEREDGVKSPIKQHPPPFDEALEREKMHDYVRRAPDAPGSDPHLMPLQLTASEMRVTTPQSSKSPHLPDIATETPFDQGSTYLNKNNSHNRITPPLSRANTVASLRSASRSRVQSAESHRGRQYQLTSKGQEGNADTGLVNTRGYQSDGCNDVPENEASDEKSTKQGSEISANSNSQGWVSTGGSANDLTKDCQQNGTSRIPRQASDASFDCEAQPGGSSTSLPQQNLSNSMINSDNEITDTLRSYHEIRDSLMHTAKKGNLSPTTGQFIDHFVQKTEEEVNQIAAELEQDLQDHRRKLASGMSSSSLDSGQGKTRNHQSPPELVKQTSTVGHTKSRNTKTSRAELTKAHYSSGNPPVRALLASTEVQDQCKSTSPTGNTNSNSNVGVYKKSRAKSPSVNVYRQLTKAQKLLPQRNKIRDRQLHMSAPVKMATADGEPFEYEIADKKGHGSVTNNHAEPVKRTRSATGSKQLHVQTIDHPEGILPIENGHTDMPSHHDTAVDYTLTPWSKHSEEHALSENQSNNANQNNPNANHRQSSQLKKHSSEKGAGLTKVSLMISRGHHDSDQTLSNSGHLAPLNRPGRPPLFKNPSRRK